MAIRPTSPNLPDGQLRFTMRSTNFPIKNTFSILLSLEPAVGALAGWLVLAEHLTLAQGVAIALVMAASMGTAWSAGQDKRVTPGSGQA